MVSSGVCRGGRGRGRSRGRGRGEVDDSETAVFVFSRGGGEYALGGGRLWKGATKTSKG